MGARGRVPRGRASGRNPGGTAPPCPAPPASGYREQALRLFPHVCARCGREFSGARLRELTVHHKDHDHHNNPPDGSNWELLCLYCHDDAHQDPYARGPYTKDPLARPPESVLGYSPFEALKEPAVEIDGQHEENE